ncbi:glycosyltransferase family 2 protein [Agaribacter flavus]|uniref:Glycosyltransferase family 2 protein n=1 Tax=Agaribacter flavus TaxID=1902781 RepID=A0ABV7FXE5_9ALTE
MLFNLKKNKALTIKLVAIAKDEAAYLPEWIFHHLQSGFDSIDIYVNHTSDNTWEIAQCLQRETRVRFIDGDEFFYEGNKNPQNTVYQHAYKTIDNKKFDYLMFLDIDEFWFNKGDFVSVKDRLAQLNYPSVLCLNWFNKHNESDFSDIYDTQQHGVTSAWVKTIFSTQVKVKHIEIHNVKTAQKSYTLGDGSIWNWEQSQGPVGYLPEPLQSCNVKETFILHRMNRSQMEYVSLLSRGAARQNQKGMSRFKTNRSGYCFTKTSQQTIVYKDQQCLEYKHALAAFVSEYNLTVPLQDARTFIRKRFHASLTNIKTSPTDNLALIERITKNVTLPEVLDAKNVFMQAVVKEKKLDIANTLRELAISMEKIDLKTAQDLMAKALEYKPSGPMIKRKLQEYRNRLSDERNT